MKERETAKKMLEELNAFSDTISGAIESEDDDQSRKILSEAFDEARRGLKTIYVYFNSAEK